MKYSAIIVLANLMDREGFLNEETSRRMDLAIEEFNKDKAPWMITCGWDYRDDSSIKIADAMKKYAKEKNIPVDRIIVELNSRDTVGDAIFTKNNIVKNKEWKKILVVTSDYHVDRTRKIFEFVYGDQYHIDVIGSETEQKNELKINEERSLNKFYETFEGIESGSDDLIKNRLIDKHPFYNGEIYSKVCF
ncbi:protein of unknown function DUF218 [Denitrovibrio acetiphilus DSM 12809]|jgi:uncharacterized SAM-binding protein YcdF (DUF218 family)|uniref:DUF218 domain-containing protein n=1 Tax=Denitrovibrio acetiphilus (strain DSM 12809 / NBRC 114555 / N2460) TaxID=522772 RepID=D4H4M4_DENA2|nr:YdcF family protein [Denitrovibrio acetiphilus]ADD67418.1 protein of unknown function DUF218 [Denitrovibrio acetiphilus DSM 12809]